MDRKDFIKKTGLVGAGICTLGPMAILSSCTKIVYVDASRKEDVLTINASDFGTNDFLVLKNNSLDAPIFLKKEENGTYIALSMLCTHRGCVVAPSGAVLTCPCHGAEFDQSGKVLSPPASRPLDSYEVRVDNGQININL
jgi:cytochrome b6-f complex iron-sulfur subunit